ncbi:MAG TPA: DUF3313 family protein [Woeseiaceae bacterium]|nr:DUF3313 family protein [Woeseiaceae bacterium]
MSIKKLVTIVLASSCLFASIAFAWNKYPDQTDDGLDRVKSKQVDALYWKEGATLAGYKRVRLDDCSVAFRKHWLVQQNMDRMGLDGRVTTADMERIQNALSDAFREVFTKELESGGYEVVAESGSDVLLLQPKIVDLDVTAPDTRQQQAAMVNSYTASSGEMTLHMDFLDSSTNALIGRVIDNRQDNADGNFQYSNGLTNRGDADEILQKWATALRKALDNAHQISK